MINKSLREQLLSMITEDGGKKISLVRTSIASILLAYIVWATWIVVQTRIIPDLPLQVAALLGTLYGLNKAIKVNIGVKGGPKK